MQARNKMCSTWMPLLALLVAACSGSGSSGFDVTSEDAVIQQALEGNRCVENGGLFLCPSGVSPLLPSPGPRPSVELGIAADGIVECTPSGSDAACGFLLPIVTQSMPPGAALRVAARSAGSGAEWTI